MSINIEDLTIKQVRDLSALFSEKPTDPHPYRVQIFHDCRMGWILG